MQRKRLRVCIQQSALQLVGGRCFDLEIGHRRRHVLNFRGSGTLLKIVGTKKRQ